MKTKKISAFTMPELLVVMAIILLFIVLAVPVMNVLSGSRSIAGAQNTIQMIMARAREEAIGLQRTYGVLFTIDPVSDRVRATIVREADPAFQPPPTREPVPIIWLDTVPGHDYVMLPDGIRLQTVFDGNVVRFPSQRYLGYDATGFGDGQAKMGGVILFDRNGRLIVRRYGLATTHHTPNPNGVPVADSPVANIVDVFFRAQTPKTSESVGGLDGYIPFESSPGTGPWPMSQLGFCLFDRKTFTSAGFTDSDQGQQNEDAKQEWLDQNATPFLVNRFTGTLIRGE